MKSESVGMVLRREK